jgi:hypothetical protein
MRILLMMVAATAALVAEGPVPDSLKPPASEAVVLKAVGKGQQVYVCKSKGGGEGLEWALLKPRAVLYDEKGGRIGTHYEGPTWEASDGSKVTGQVLQRAAAPDAGAVPWLLLKASSNQGTGMLAHVTYINRVNTRGGAAPASGCTIPQAGTETSVDYQADYIFYGSAR